MCSHHGATKGFITGTQSTQRTCRHREKTARTACLGTKATHLDPGTPLPPVSHHLPSLLLWKLLDDDVKWRMNLLF